MTAQTGPHSGVGFSTALRRASMSFRSTEAKPAGIGRKVSWNLSWPVAASVARVRPWKDFFASSLTSPQRRASLMAPSLASAPEFAKKVFQVTAAEPMSWPDSSVMRESRVESPLATSPRFST